MGLHGEIVIIISVIYCSYWFVISFQHYVLIGDDVAVKTLTRYDVAATDQIVMTPLDFASRTVVEMLVICVCV